MSPSQYGSEGVGCSSTTVSNHEQERGMVSPGFLGAVATSWLDNALFHNQTVAVLLYVEISGDYIGQKAPPLPRKQADIH